MTSRAFVEKVSGIRTTVVTSNEFMYDRYYRNPDGLYVFTSRTGTSHFVREAQRHCKEQGYLTVAISESADTPLAKESCIFINMGSGEEDCPMRTIGYCASVLIHMLMGLEIGRTYGYILKKEYEDYLEDARQQSENLSAGIGMDGSGKKKNVSIAASCIYRGWYDVWTGAGKCYESMGMSANRICWI